MNRSALKTYAPKARLEFIRAVTDRAAFFGLTPDRTEAMQETGDVVLIGGRAFPRVVAEQRKKLQERISQHGFDQVMEAMAYTWFNRFVALRYMELHGYLEHGYRVLSQAEGKTTPEILEHAEHVTLPGLDAQQVINLKLDGSREAELYRLLLVAQCNALHEAMPFLFEKIADETELLLPDNLLHSDSLIRKLVNEIDEVDWQQVEIIGWLYQFYISDKKAEVIGNVVKSEDIPAATQLFTPNWIVKYLVQNTLGRQWLATYPDSPLRQQMEYYIAPAEQTAEVNAQLAAITPKSLDPETLTLLDPASGSGHILVEAYDLFKAIYQERGYRSKDIPRLILTQNLFGLEIDDRAAQLAAFALMMKARADDRRIFAEHVQPNVIAIQESKGLDNLLRPNPAAATGMGELPFADRELFPQTEKQLTLNKSKQESPLSAVEPCLRELVKLFEHGKTFGSLIRVPSELAAQLPAARQGIEAMVAKGQLWEHRAAALLLPLVRQAELLARSYDNLVANPPYLGGKYMNPVLKKFALSEYPESKPDVAAMFVERSISFCSINRPMGFVVPYLWMFNSSFGDFRQHLESHCVITNLTQLEYNAFEPACVPVCTFTLLKSVLPTFRGAYIRLSEFKGHQNQPPKTLEAIRNPKCGWFHISSWQEFSKIPGRPIAYWITENVRNLFFERPHMKAVADSRVGLQTSDNDRFVRFWHEVSIQHVGFSPSGNEAENPGETTWVPLNKGGVYRKWFGNFEHVVKWKNKGQEIKAFPASVVRNEEYYFREAITWSDVTSSDLSMRWMPKGFIPNNVAHTAFFSDDAQAKIALGLANTPLFNELAKLLSPSLHFSPGYFDELPYIGNVTPTVVSLVDQAIAMSKEDWDSQESSWDFEGSPLTVLRGHQLVSTAFDAYQSKCDSAVEELHGIEENINREFHTAAGVEGEFSSRVPRERITLYRPDRGTDIRRLISYALGCMMGRYSLDKSRLVYAHSRNEGFDASQYQTFPADADGIIPITELAWFSDAVSERFVEFIGKAWPAAHLEENLKFIADSLGANRDEHPRDTIRRYLSQNFYKDHLQTYKRRPIYCLFSSGKQKAFSCLVYLHRYHEGTLSRMRTEYVIPLQGKLSHRIEQLAGDITAATSTSHRRKLEKERESLVKQRTELAAFDEKLRHYADQRIALDLDDGVKVNYGKFGDLLAEVKAVTGGTEE